LIGSRRAVSLLLHECLTVEAAGRCLKKTIDARILMDVNLVTEQEDIIAAARERAEQLSLLSLNLQWMPVSLAFSGSSS
jgi:hypothetical protein